MQLAEHHSKTSLAEVLEAADALRAATRAAVAPLVRSDDGARACARTLGLDKSLGWKIHQIAFCTESVDALSAMPGSRGWEIALQGLATAGADAEAVARVRTAHLAFERALLDGRIDRKTLAGMVAALADNDSGRRQILRMRKSATESSALLYGAHMVARIGAYLVMPSRSKPGFVDLAALTILEGIERRRPGNPWPIYTPMFRHPTGSLAMQLATELALDADDKGGFRSLVRSLSSPDLGRDEIAPSAIPGSRAITFLSRSASRGAPLRLAFAESLPAAGSAYATPGDDEVYMGLPPGTPCDMAVFDVLIHRDVARGSDPESRYSLRQISSNSSPDEISAAMHEHNELPVDAEVTRPESLRLAGMLSSANSAYEALAGRATQAFGYRASDFEIFRTAVEYPPVPGMLITSWRLASAR